MRHDVYHLPGGCPSYVRGRVVIIGYAAHALDTPPIARDPSQHGCPVSRRTSSSAPLIPMHDDSIQRRPIRQGATARITTVTLRDRPGRPTREVSIVAGATSGPAFPGS